MSWPLKLTQRYSLSWSEKDRPFIGECWYGDPDIPGLSIEFKRDWAAKRNPLWVVLPDETVFCVDQVATNANGSGWTVTGEAPNITVSPSINIVGHYHGWIRNGVITDDVEGRRFA